jgi:TRAP-type C4-dicarboxylate transport system permease small subunit
LSAPAQGAVPARRGAPGLLRRASLALAALERRLVILGMALILALILLNVATRAAGAALFWVDEAAVFAMVFVTFIGASWLVHLRLDFAVTLLTDPLPTPLRHAARVVADLTVLFFGLLMVVLCWWWFDLPGIAGQGWDVQAYFLETFNGIYGERPTTIPIRKFWFFLVMPWFALTLTLHAVANLAEDVVAMLGREEWRERREAEI